MSDEWDGPHKDFPYYTKRSTTPPTAASGHGHHERGEEVMPYIPEERRDELDDAFARTGDAGDTTYILYRIALDMLPNRPRFSDYCTLLGALEATKLELYRRHIAPYEDKKLEENGDVY